MQKTNIQTLRNEATRQVQLLKKLLEKIGKSSLIQPATKDAHNRATFDADSLPEALEILEGESHKLQELDMVLAVVGTMKAGKSTSINAIVGAEVLPNRNRPMTALPTLIRHTPDVLQPRLILRNVDPLNKLTSNIRTSLRKRQFDPETIQNIRKDPDLNPLLEWIEFDANFTSRHEGEGSIFNFLKRLNDLVRLSFELNVGFPYASYATVDTMPVIEVEFSHLKNTPATQGRLTLLDTPGPNEAGQQHLRHMLKDQLKKASAVLAVLDYTQLKSDADAQVRDTLVEISQTAKDRMYALVNKFDQRDRNSDNAETVKSYVSQQLLNGTMGSECVFPVSSKQGYLASRALNEIERNGQLPLHDSWVEDFGDEAFGKRWEKYIGDPKEAKNGAKDLWEDSGFARPLRQVIVEAHQNAAIEALRSATSKLQHYTREAGDFLKASAGTLRRSAADLQKNIDNLQHEIERISQTEQEADETLNASLKNVRTKIESSTQDTLKSIAENLKTYFAEGKKIENETKKKRNNNPPRHPNAGIDDQKKSIIQILGIKLLEVKDDKEKEEEFDFDPNSPIIEFSDGIRARDFRDRIEKSIRNLMSNAETATRSSIEQGLIEFSINLKEHGTRSLEKIRSSIQSNVDDMGIEIQPPSVKSIELDSSVSRILSNAIEEKTRRVTRHRRKSGAWGTVCGWFNTDDWGWESYQADEDYFQVDLTKIYDSANNAVQQLLTSARDVLTNDIYPQLHRSVAEYFETFRQKIEHLRGDLLSGIERNSLDKSEKDQLLSMAGQLTTEASNLEDDATTLNDAIESMRLDIHRFMEKALA